MKKINTFFITAAFIAPMILFGCGNDAKKKKPAENNATYQNQNLPGNFLVTIPNSLKSSSTGKRSIQSGVANRKESAMRLNRKSTILNRNVKTEMQRAGDPSFGYSLLKSYIAELVDNADNIAIDMMYIDSIYDEMTALLVANGGVIVTINEGVINYTYTQEIMNAEVALYVKNGWATVDEAKAFLQPYVGITFPCPQMIFEKDLSDLDNDGFHYTLTADWINGASSDVDKNVIQWSTDKNLISIAYYYAYTGDPIFGTESGDFKITYNSTLNKVISKMSYSSGGLDMSNNITLQEVTGTTTNGVKIDVNFTMKGLGMDQLFEIDGMADNNGGFIKFSIIDNITPSNNFFYKESFDGAGNLTGQSYCLTENGIYTNTAVGDPTTTSYDDNPGDWEVSSEIYLNISGGDMTGATPFYFYIVPFGSTDYALNPDLLFTDMIGSGYWDGTSASNSYWGTSAQYGTGGNGLELWKEDYVSNKYVYSPMTVTTISMAK